MNKKIFWSILWAIMLGTCVLAEAKKVHTLGDSTMANYDESATVTRGWGMYFGNFLTGDWTSVNYARGGRDSRSGYNELWAAAKSKVEAGDYVIIQFSHNDEMFNGVDREELYNYYIAKGETATAAALDGRGTHPSTTYKAYLKKIVDEVQALGANPILVGPVCRAYFGSDGKITRTGQHDLGDRFDKLENGVLSSGNKVSADDNSMDYPYYMQQLATEEGIPYIDMTNATKSLYESYGKERCLSELFSVKVSNGETVADATHFNTTGALLAARMCAQLMKEAGILADNITIPVDLSVSPESGDMGDIYNGQTATKEFTLNGFGLDPATGTITITATDGVELSTDKQNWQSSLSIDYSSGTLVKTFYARATMTTAGAFASTIIVSLGSQTIEVPLTANVVELGGGEPFSVTWPLTANDDATVSGDITAGAVTLSALVKQRNDATQGLRASVSGGSWPAGEDDAPNRYIEAKVTCPEGKTLDINNIQLAVGSISCSDINCHVYYSTDNFATRTTIYAPTGMTANVLNEVQVSPVIQLEEGQSVILRIYPWSAKEYASGKYIAAKDIVISGQVKNAGGVEIEGSIVYQLDKGGLTQGDDAIMTPEELNAGFVSKKWTAGDGIQVSGVLTYTNGNIKQTQIRNISGTKFSTEVTADNTLTLTLTPEDGFNFVPSKVSFEAARYGTDGGNITVSIEAGSQSEEICNNAGVNRSGKGLDIASFEKEVSNIVASSTDPLKVNFSFVNMNASKDMGLSNLVIEGTLVGSASTATKYVLHSSVLPDGEAGTITRDPDLAAYKEGTSVTLTAERNFGYRFVEWQDGTGASLSTEASINVTMDEEKTVNAVFEAVTLYTVTTEVTNDKGLALGSITLTPNNHDGQYEAGTQITATAEESKILTFLGWTDGNENADATATRTLTVNGDMTLTANYEIEDFIAVFDASRVQSYAYPTTAGYPFAADITCDDERNTKASVVRVSDGSLLYTQSTGTPVVRNRQGVVISAINGLYQNGYRTTDIAFQYQFSTLGFSNISFVADMAAKNAATKEWKAQLSTDGSTWTDIEGATWTATANVVNPVNITLPATADNQATVYLRITGVGTETFNTSYPFDKEFDKMDYCDHSESGVGNVFVLGTATPATITLSPAKEYTTYCSTESLDFTDVEGLTAYVVTSVNAQKAYAVLTEVTLVPAGTGIILHKTGEASTFDVNIISEAEPIADNKLVGVTKPTVIGNEAGYTHYIIKNGKLYEAVESTLAAGKAYLRLADDEKPDLNGSTANGISLTFDAETTGIHINTAEQTATATDWYNLSGQRVNSGTENRLPKGIYIVGGKKVIIK